MFCSVKVGHFSDQVYHYYIGGPKNHGLLPCDIGGAKEPGMMLLNEELNNPRILKLTG